MVMSLELDPILRSNQYDHLEIPHIRSRTAPYFEICLTKRDANLNNGRGTMVTAAAYILRMPGNGLDRPNNLCH